jgi:hypothetical protein
MVPPVDELFNCMLVCPDPAPLANPLAAALGQPALPDLAAR